MRWFRAYRLGVLRASIMQHFPAHSLKEKFVMASRKYGIQAFRLKAENH